MTIRGCLIDLEGVLYQDGAALPGARNAITDLKARGLSLRFLTNTTTGPRRAIVERLTGMGLDVDAADVFTPPIAAHRALKAKGAKRVHLAAVPALAEDFADFDLVEGTPDARPDAVVLGDLYKGFTWERLNTLFRMVRAGAELIALHKNRVSRRDGVIALDLGPFVAAIEYAAHTDALVVGKPAAAFFDLALADMGLAAEAVVMVGDDIESDIGGAKAAGLRAVQVRTGKYSSRDDDHPDVQPDGRIDDITTLADWIETC